jgi:MYXO-CTERM domain-containing protein
MLASSLLLLPVATTFAQTATPPPETRPPDIQRVETRTEHDRTGLWGLLGLAGLLGLTGSRRRDEPVRTYTDPRERTRT